MRSKQSEFYSLKPIYFYFTLGLVLWTLLISFSLYWNINREKERTRELAKSNVRSNFNKDQAVRQWAARQGGVYIPINEYNQPNPFLSHITERDITTPSGKVLTLMNPAWMMRRLMSEYSELYKVKGRITSLQLMNPINAPDEWETSALKRFEKGASEIFEFSRIDGIPYLRLMRPLYIKAECLKCHAFQGYKVGDVRGGMGVSISMEPFLTIEQETIRVTLFTHGMFWFLITVVMLYIMHRSRLRILELAEKETSLREVKENLTDAQKIAHLGSFNLALKTNEFFWSEEAFRIYRHPQHIRPLLYDFFQYVHPQDRKFVEEEYKLALNSDKILNIDHRIIRKDGVERYIHTKGEILRDESDNPIYLVGTIHDITPQKKAEVALIDSETKFRTVTESAYDAIITFSKKGHILLWNNSATKIFGFDFSEIKEKSFESILTESSKIKFKEEFLYNPEMMSDQSEGQSIELHGIDKKGREFPIQCSFSAWKVEDGLFFTCIIRDVTEQKEYENNLYKAKEDAEAANHAKSRFLSTMSHELRTPMNGVLGMAELALMTNLDESQREYIQTISHSGEALLKIINEILDLTKVESRLIELDNHQFKINDLIDNLIDLFTGSAHSKKLDLHCSIPENLTDKIIGDSNRLSQILSNLLANAIKFTTSGAINFNIEIIEEKPLEITFRFIVEDTGIGIPKDKLQTIFQTFTQADDSSTRRFGGVGIGLALVSSLTKLMHGNVGVESEEGKGSKFWVILSFKKYIAETEQLVESKSKVKDTPKKKNPEKIKILLVEDDRINQTVIEKMILSLGYQIDILPNGRAAVEIIPNIGYDLIFMDCLMPLMDGFEATKHIRNMESDGTIQLRIPIIALTAKAMKGDKEKCFEAGMDGFLSKPVTIDDLQQTIETYLA